ncbi:MAG: dipicolinate synthase subunit B [Defluviitaleaceae bacterium]|nr:dipicolinate synthase subunit B [Defluviitaleaceae bacterium]
MKASFEGKRMGFALTGSFCTLDAALTIISDLVRSGAEVVSIISQSVDTMDTKFGTAEGLKEKLTELTGQPVITTILEAEPIGPAKLLDILVVLPATGNTMAKIAYGITDTTVTMAVKAHLRNNRPVVLGLSSNDALGSGAKNIGMLLGMRNIYFVPFGQDNPHEKPRSMVLKGEYTLATIDEALHGRQLQPMVV